MFNLLKHGREIKRTQRHTEDGGREQVSKEEREHLVFFCVISVSTNTANTHTHTHTLTHTQGCLLSEAFPRCCATKLPHQDGRMKQGRNGRKYRGMEGQPSEAYTHCRDKHIPQRGFVFRRARSEFKTDGLAGGRVTGHRESSGDKQAYAHITHFS